MIMMTHDHYDHHHYDHDHHDSMTLAMIPAPGAAIISPTRTALVTPRAAGAGSPAARRRPGGAPGPLAGTGRVTVTARPGSL